MRRKINAVLIVLVLLSMTVVPVNAASAHLYIYDQTSSLSEDEVTTLNAEASQVYDTYGVGVYFVLAGDTGGADISDFAEKMYDSLAVSDNGILLAVTSDYGYVYSSGTAEKLITQETGNALISAYDDQSYYYDAVDAYIIKAASMIQAGEGSNAADTAAASGNTAVAGDAQRVVDNAGLLSDSEEKALTDKLNGISEKQECDVIVVTVNSLDGKTATAYADDYFDYNGYGIGNSRDGILFLVSMESHDWAISTSGFGITAFTDAGQKYITDQITKSLSDKKYNEAFTRYADLCDNFLTQARTGKPYDSSNLPKKPLSLVWIPLALLIGLVIAFVVTWRMKSKLRSVRFEPAARNYLVDGSFELTTQRDTFLYFTVSRIEKPQDNGSGSSVHTSSSGESHGGSSGKF